MPSLILSHTQNSTPKKFIFIIKLKFLFVIIKLILLMCVYLTYDENLFSGLSLTEERESKNYNTAKTTVVTGITFLCIFALVELFILFIGYTNNFLKNNIIILSLNIFCVYLLGYFIFDAWHYVTIWYIFIVAQFPQTILEIYGFIYSIVYDIMKYNKIKAGDLTPIQTSK